MLVLSRHRDESIVIGGDDVFPLVKITVVEVRGDKVRLGLLQWLSRQEIEVPED